MGDSYGIWYGPFAPLVYRIHLWLTQMGRR
ncbi:hypothetical protein C8K36_10498 [Rhodococcus sp. OK519]|nr:hypothetical protein C8K36_10498 [Rhodococcus sp. OK519]